MNTASNVESAGGQPIKLVKQQVKLHRRKKDFVSLCRIVLCGAAEKAYIESMYGVRLVSLAGAARLF